MYQYQNQPTPTYISESCLSMCVTYHHYIDNYLSKQGKTIIPTQQHFTTSSEYCNFLNYYILSLGYDVNATNKFIKEMMAACKRDIDDFSWLEDDRLCYYAWLYIKNHITLINEPVNNNYKFSIEKVPVPLNTSKNCAISNILNMPLNLMPFNTEMRAKMTKDYILSLENNEKRIAIINNIKSAWSNIKKFKVPFKFLMNDEQQIDWAWSYILHKFKNKFIHQYNHFMRLVIPTNIEEKYHASFAIHDYFYTSNEDIHKEFCKGYKKAFNQKKFREKQGVKSINVQLDVKVKKQLDQLLYHYQYSQQRLLEMLISEHYKLVKNNLNLSNYK